MIHPLASWLAKRPRKPARAIWGGLGIGLGALALGAWAWLNWQAAVLDGLLLTGLAALLIAPLIVAALSAALTALELRGEQFQFVLLTNLPEKLIVQGCIAAAVHRTRAVRALAAAAIPALTVGILAEYLRIFAPFYTYPYILPGDPSGASTPELLMPTLVSAALALFLWGLNLLAARLGAVAALRWRSPALVVVLAPLILLAMIVVAPLLMMGMPLLCPIGVYLILRLVSYLFGYGLLRDARYWVRRGDV